MPSEEKRQPKYGPLPDYLPRNEEILSPGDACGHCDGKLKLLGDDVAKELESIPGRFVMNGDVPAPGFRPVFWKNQDRTALGICPR